GQTAPNPMVGAVVVRSDEIIAEGWHTRFGELHAEVEALRAAGDRSRGATLYTSLEPCNSHGKQPPCVDAILHAGIARVVIAATDPNPAMRRGLPGRRAGGIETTTGIEEEAAIELNASSFTSLVLEERRVQLDGSFFLDAGGRFDPSSTKSRQSAAHCRIRI